MARPEAVASTGVYPLSNQEFRVWGVQRCLRHERLRVVLEQIEEAF